MVSWLLTNALAISATLKPQRVFKINDTCASAQSDGWQHTNIIRNWSSSIVLVFIISCTVGTNEYSDYNVDTIVFENVAALFCRRKTSMALLRATVNNHADGFLGSPFIFQLLKAFNKVSCTTS